MKRTFPSAMLAMALLAGCGSKPPDCPSPEALSVAQSAMADGFTSATSEVYSDPANVFEPADIAKVRSEIASYAKALKVSIGNVVQNGYDANARRFTCSGKLAIATPTGKNFSRDTDYSIQATADGKGTFVLQVAQPTPFISSLQQDFAQLLSDKNIKVHFRQGPSQGGTSSAGACVDAKMAAAKRELDARLDIEMKEAEAKGYLFKGLSPVQEDEWQEKNLQKARQECP
jgi:hypothetical protein